jgi:hypothetical protein
LDTWRSAAFLGFLFESPAIRVVGADGKAGPFLDAAIDQLCQDGWLTDYACNNRRLTYEVTNGGAGWYYFHHHHMHVSINSMTYSQPLSMECLVTNCDERPLNDYLGQFGLAPRTGLDKPVK